MDKIRIVEMEIIDSINDLYFNMNLLLKYITDNYWEVINVQINYIDNDIIGLKHRIMNIRRDDINEYDDSIIEILLNRLTNLNSELNMIKEMSIKINYKPNTALFDLHK